ncbi:MAG: DUF1566 domain-containing protein [Roseateles sp.]|uniref:DUF1566 domain-containing protein n=1 Tax=Roseateles sp. TaxID=1971397 RepID=UPI00403538FA
MQLHISNSTIHLSVLPSAMLEGETLRSLEPLATAAYIGDTPQPGEYWNGQGGRFICTLPALHGLPARHLIVGGREAEGLTFGPNVEVPGAGSHADGASNTTALLAHPESHPAAKWAAEYSADGHTDFHLPSRLDLLMAYICAPQLFKKSGWYWSSTQYSRFNAFVQDFEHGNSAWDCKGTELRVRAVRWIRLDALNA